MPQRSIGQTDPPTPRATMPFWGLLSDQRIAKGRPKPWRYVIYCIATRRGCAGAGTLDSAFAYAWQQAPPLVPQSASGTLLSRELEVVA